MKSAPLPRPVVGGETAPESSRPPWGWALLLGAVFFVAHPHALDASRQFAEREELGAKEEKQATANAEAVGEGSPRRRASLSALACVASLVWIRRGGAPIRMRGLLAWTLAALTFLVASSFLWADDSVLALRRSISLGLLALSALVVAQQVPGKSLLWLTVVVLTSYLAIGFASEVALGTFQPWKADYRFAGTLHPNRQGMNCAVLILAALALLQRGGSWSVYGSLIVGAGVLLVLTGSRTSLASVLLGGGVLWLITATSAQRMFGFVMGGALLSSFLFAAAAWNGEELDKKVQAIFFLGRTDGESSNASLTGRVPLWEECLSYASYRPVLGYGYKAFWTPQRILKISNNQGWSIMAAHSGYVDALLSLGLIGLAAFVTMIATGVSAAWQAARQTFAPAAAFALALLCWLASNSVLETFLDEPLFVSFVAWATLCKLAFIENPQWELKEHSATTAT